MTPAHFHLGDECYINGSPAFPELAGAKCKIVGELMVRQKFNDMGFFVGVHLCYLIEVNGLRMCAPPVYLREKLKRADWGSLRKIWQPKRVAR